MQHLEFAEIVALSFVIPIAILALAGRAIGLKEVLDRMLPRWVRVPAHVLLAITFLLAVTII